MTDRDFMTLAIEQAKIAASELEVPVGAVIVRNGEVVSLGRNRREKGRNALAHAELEAIDLACKKLGGWRLWECEMFVTLEPCPMCAGAIINARINRVFFGAYDKVMGSFQSVADFSTMGYPNPPEIHGGILEAECKQLLGDFFEALRK